MIDPENISNVASLDWGKQNEINATEAFMQQEGIHHRNPKLLPSGLVISKSHPYSVTPDNIFVCSCSCLFMFENIEENTTECETYKMWYYWGCEKITNDLSSNFICTFCNTS